MKFEITRNALLQPLKTVAGIIESRAQLPIFSNIMLDVTQDKLTLTASDGDIELSVRTKTQETFFDGDITVNGGKFYSIIRNLGDEKSIVFELDGNEYGSKAVLRSGRSRFKLNTLPAGDFPDFQPFETRAEFRIKQSELAEMLRRVAFAMGVNDVRYYINATLLHCEGIAIRTVTTDGHRLATTVIKIDGADFKDVPDILLPRKTCLELAKLLQGDELITVGVGEQQISFESDNFTMTSKLVDGSFPDWQSVIPIGNDKKAVIKTAQLKSAIAQAIVLSNEKHKGVRFKLSNGMLELQARNSEQDESNIEIEIEYDGEPLELGFNAVYVDDAVRASDSDEIEWHIGDSVKPLLINPVGNTGVKFVVMPMRL